jgi:hypothetical protein
MLARCAREPVGSPAALLWPQPIGMRATRSGPPGTRRGPRAGADAHAGRARRLARRRHRAAARSTRRPGSRRPFAASRARRTLAPSLSESHGECCGRHQAPGARLAGTDPPLRGGTRRCAPAGIRSPARLAPLGRVSRIAAADGGPPPCLRHDGPPPPTATGERPDCRAEPAHPPDRQGGSALAPARARPRAALAWPTSLRPDQCEPALDAASKAGERQRPHRTAADARANAVASRTSALRLRWLSNSIRHYAGSRTLALAVAWHWRKPFSRSIQTMAQQGAATKAAIASRLAFPALRARPRRA